MNEVKAVQKVVSRCTEEIVEESKFLVQFTDFAKDIISQGKNFVSEKVKLFFVDAEWWITIRPDNSLPNRFVLQVHISRSAGQVELKNCKFNVAIKTTKFKDYMSEWNEMTNDRTQYKTREIGYRALEDLEIQDVSIDIVLTFKRFHNPPIKSKFSNPIEDYCNIIETFSNLKDDSTFADFKFIVKGKEFKIQKCILAASSPVFARLFTSDMQEARENVCIIDSFEPEIFESVLQFIYRAKLPANFPETAQEIYEVADYYDLKRLKDICAKEILSQLSKDNAVEFYCWAYAFDSLEELKKDSWEMTKRDVLHIYFRIKNEPLAPEALKELVEKQHHYLQYLENVKDDPEQEKNE